MTCFEEITASPEALGAFLAKLPVPFGPWDGLFNRMFCDSCERENCDDAPCPHQAERNNPTWWLRQGAAYEDYKATAGEVKSGVGHGEGWADGT